MAAVAPERPVPPLPGRGPNPAPDLPRPGEDDDGVPGDDTDEPETH